MVLKNFDQSLSESKGNRFEHLKPVKFSTSNLLDPQWL